MSVTCSAAREPTGPESQHRLAYEVHQGVHIHRVPTTSLGRRSTLSRMADYLSFYARAVVKAVRLPRFDAVVTLTTPPIIGLIGTLLRRLRGSPHVYWSMDLHPDASLALGRMSLRNPVVRGLAWLSDFVYRQADRVVVLGPYMADRVLCKGVRPDRLVTIPVWSRRDEVYPGRARDQSPAQEPRPGRQVRGHVLGESRAGPLVRRVPGSRPPPPRSRRYRLRLCRLGAAGQRGTPGPRA